jgi:2-polyprenyl-6-methoxyphenol hydroxylase-like FAD-dependent oxidoreductase
MPQAIVIGGGIAGLASAASLLRAGWAVTVLERAQEFTEVGAGVAITGNGMTALDTMGIGAAVRGVGRMVRTAGFQDRDGRWVVRIPDLPIDRDPSTWVCAVHRQRLHAALLRAADGADLLTDARVTGVRAGAPSGEPAVVTWVSKGSAHDAQADLVVAADGLRSTTRAQLFPHVVPRYGGSTSWRAVIDDTTLVDDRFIAAWGPGAEFGALRISDTEVYWYGYFRHPEGAAFVEELAAAHEKPRSH